MLDPVFVESRIEEFKRDLKTKDNIHMVSKYFYNDYEPAAINLDTYHALRWEIKEHFNLESIFDVFLVGSARLGFSIKPTDQFRYFNDQSDLDVVIVSKPLFEEYWKAARDSTISLEEWKHQGVYEDYFFKGWMRPDKLRYGGEELDVKKGWQFFGKLSQSRKYGPYPINGGLYYSLDFLEHYQTDAIERIRTFGEML